MGNNMCYYLCCCYCCCCRQKYNKKDRYQEKRRTLKVLSKIAKDHKQRQLGSDPIKLKLRDMGEFYEIPTKQYKTADDVIAMKGYRQDRELGSGKYGTVFLMIHINSGEQLACKVLVLDDRMRSKGDRHKLTKDIKYELFALERLRHPYVVKLVTHFNVDNTADRLTTFYIVMQYAVGGTLNERNHQSGPFDEDLCRTWFGQMLSALVYMHSRNIAHRDIKPQNILLDVSDDILISDFGLSRVVYRQGAHLESKTFCGTASYMAPELLNIKVIKQQQILYGEDKQTKPGYNAKLVDVWALGVVLYNLFTKQFPYYSARHKHWSQALTEMQSKQYRFSSQFKPSADLVDIIDQMLEPNPKRRPDMLSLTQHKYNKN
ncbi:sperm motility kinase-like [Oppia nitens]|uniref:sperm motility kinase-like n=1 Tax=Oppia nitens TaxID=1686743 RepID=UPI0023DB8F4B|nr:sperm motility kinase-like [Oppia nitens]